MASWSPSLTFSFAQGKGALLLAVVGAKLSEGLNFSDDLARLVMVIGLPFANLGSAELQERLKHADRLAGEVAQKNSAYGAAGKELYENMCMNSVNQSIGKQARIVRPESTTYATRRPCHPSQGRLVDACPC